MSWTAWALVLVFVDPEAAGIPGLVFFYASLALAIVGTISVLGLLLRARFNKQELVSRLAGVSFRQGVWVAAAIISALLLENMEMFKWWILLLIVGALAIIEFLFLSLKRRLP